MSNKHPIVAVTGSSGAGTTNVRKAFENIFQNAGIKPAIIEGDSFHRFDRKEMDEAVEKGKREGKLITHFGPEGNLFEQLEQLFRDYSENGMGKQRHYVHNEKEATKFNNPIGTLTPWENIEPDTDLLFYEGLHGGLETDEINIVQYVDLLIGVTPIINLEWIQKIHRDKAVRGYSVEDATSMILRRMHDYVHYITPQFSRTDINFQRVPTVDTSNPFAAASIPTSNESFTVIHISNHEKLPVNFDELLTSLGGSFMTRPDTIVIPEIYTTSAIQLIITPAINKLIEQKNVVSL